MTDASQASTTGCLCCGSTARGRHFDVPETMFGLGETFRYDECSACGTLQLARIPGDLGRYYPEGYFSFASRRSARPSSAIRRIAASVVVGSGGILQQLIVRSRSPSWADWFAGTGMRLDEPVLDVGSGSGGLLLHLARYGFTRLEGVDPFVPEDIDYPNGVRIRKRHLAELSGSHRVIVFNHSLEHSPAPLDQLSRARALLSPGGRVVVRVPTLGGSWTRYGVAFVGLEEAPRHVFVPTVAGITALAARAGLTVERVLHDGNAHHVLASVRRSRDGLVPRSESAFVATRASRVRARITALLQNRAGRGDTATFLLRVTAHGPRNQ